VEVVLQEENLGVDGAGSSRPHGIISEVRVNSSFIYPLPKLGQVAFAWPMHNLESSILTTEDSQMLSSSIKPTD